MGFAARSGTGARIQANPRASPKPRWPIHRAARSYRRIDAPICWRRGAGLCSPGPITSRVQIVAVAPGIVTDEVHLIAGLLLISGGCRRARCLTKRPSKCGCHAMRRRDPSHVCLGATPRSGDRQSRRRHRNHVSTVARTRAVHPLYAALKIARPRSGGMMLLRGGVKPG